MTALATGLLVVGGLIGFAAWVWLLVVAFRAGIGWGLLILLLSWTWVPVIIFAVRHWEAAKRPILLWGVGFLLSLAAYLVAVFTLGMGFDSIVEEAGGLTSRPEPVIESDPNILPPPRPTSEPTHPSWEAVVQEVNRDEGADWETMVPTPTPITGRPGEGWLSWEELPGFIDRTMVLELENNTIVTAALEAVEPTRIRIRHVIGGGEASYWIDRDQVERIRLAN